MTPHQPPSMSRAPEAPQTLLVRMSCGVMSSKHWSGCAAKGTTKPSCAVSAGNGPAAGCTNQTYIHQQYAKGEANAEVVAVRLLDRQCRPRHQQKDAANGADCRCPVGRHGDGVKAVRVYPVRHGARQTTGEVFCRLLAQPSVNIWIKISVGGTSGSGSSWPLTAPMIAEQTRVDEWWQAQVDPRQVSHGAASKSRKTAGSAPGASSWQADDISRRRSGGESALSLHGVGNVGRPSRYYSVLSGPIAQSQADPSDLAPCTRVTRNEETWWVCNCGW